MKELSTGVSLLGHIPKDRGQPFRPVTPAGTEVDRRHAMNRTHARFRSGGRGLALALLAAAWLIALIAPSHAAEGTMAYIYDEAGRLARVDYGGGRGISYTYDDNGNLLEQEISVPVHPPIAAFEAEPAGGPAPLEVHFTDRSTGTIGSRLWDFGDGATSTLEAPIHTYTSPGSYTAVLTVTGPGGADEASQAIEVTPAEIVADFKASPTSGRLPLRVSFTCLCQGKVWSYFWDFGDGGVSRSKDPVHTYTKPGTYTVALTVRGPLGKDVATKEDYIQVKKRFEP